MVVLQKVVYARVSTTEQAKNRNALKQQLYRLNKTSPDNVYCDVQSGRRDDRPEFQKLLKAINRGVVRRLTVTNIDRIARNGRISRDILESLRDSRTELYVLDKNRLVDLLDPDDWYDVNQEGLRAERESDKIRQRVNHGLDYFRSQGKANATPPWGYVRNPKTEKYELNQNPLPEYPDIKVWEYCREAVDLYLEHKNCRMVNDILFSKYGKQHTGLHRWLVNPVLRGHTRYKLASNLKDCGQIVWNTHPDQILISESEYQAILRISKTNRKKWGANNLNARGIQKKTYPLSSLMVCAYCGGKMKHKSCQSSKNSRIVYVQCTNHSDRGNLACQFSKMLHLDQVMNQLIIELAKKAEEISNMVALELGTEVLKSEEQLRLENRLEKLKILQSAEQLPEIDLLIKKTEQELYEIKLSSQVERIVSEEHLKILKETFSNTLYFSSLLPNEQKQIFHSLIEAIIVGEEGIESIEFNFH